MKKTYHWNPYTHNFTTKGIKPMIELGDKVKDKITGLTGIASERREYLNGCVQYAVQGKFNPSKNEIPNWSIDADQLVVVEKGAYRKLAAKKPAKRKPPGGPTVKVN